MQEAELPALMTVKEAAEYLRVSDRTIHRWAGENLLDYIRIGKEYRIVRDSLPQFPAPNNKFGKS